MRLVERYIARCVATYTGTVMVVLLSIYTVLALLDELAEAGRGSYTAGRAVVYVVLTLPGGFYELLPAAALLGSVLGLGALAGASELTAMRAGGLPMSRLVGAAIRVAVVLMAMAALTGEYIAPPMEQYAKMMKSAALSGGTASRSGHGFWLRNGNTFVHVGEVYRPARLADISVYELDRSRRLTSAVRAERAAFVAGAWRLHDVHWTHLEERGARVGSAQSADWKTFVRPDLVALLAVDPGDLSVAELWRYVDFLRGNRQDASRYELALWTKVVVPVSTGVLVFVAVPFVFGPLRSVSVGQRVLAGTVAGLLFHLANQLLSHMALVYGLSPVVSATLPTALFFVGAILLLRRVR